MFGLFILLTYYFQVVLGFSPLGAGLAFLPMTLSVLASSGLVARPLLPRIAPRSIMVPGLLLAALGLALIARLGVSSDYATFVLPIEVVIGAGMGCVMVPAFSVATVGVTPREAGVASATVNVAQQVGGSVGAALLSAVAASATAKFLASTGTPGVAPSNTIRLEALVHGFGHAAQWGAGALLVAAVLAGVLIDSGKPSTQSAGQRAPRAI
jgi:hypothetical protein